LDEINVGISFGGVSAIAASKLKLVRMRCVRAIRNLVDVGGRNVSMRVETVLMAKANADRKIVNHRGNTVHGMVLKNGVAIQRIRISRIMVGVASPCAIDGSKATRISSPTWDAVLPIIPSIVFTTMVPILPTIVVGLQIVSKIKIGGP